MSDPFNHPPVNPLPPAITGLFLVIAGIELAFQAGTQGFVGGPQAVGWRLNGETTYALEGSAFIAGAAVQWLRDGLGIIESAPEIEALAGSVPDSGGVVFVPALAGLGPPALAARLSSSAASRSESTVSTTIPGLARSFALLRCRCPMKCQRAPSRSASASAFSTSSCT